MKRALTIFLSLILAHVAFSEEVKTGIYLVNMGAFNTVDGTTNVDFYISLTSLSKDKILPKIDFEFMNGTLSTCYLVDDLPYQKVYRVKATISVPVNLRNFPFEKHTIKILLEDKTISMPELTFLPDESASGLDKAVFIPGYRIYSWQITSNEHEYSVFKETYSQIEYNIKIEKPILNAFLKTLLPAICMVIVVLLSFLIKNDKIENRITAITSGLLGVIMFHSSVAGQLPPIGYLTFADKIFLLSYLVIILSLTINMFTIKLMKKNNEIAERVYSRVKYNILILYVLIVIFYCFFSVK